MTTSSFKISNTLEARMDQFARVRDDYPQLIPVIVEKTEESDVPDFDNTMYLVPADLNVGQFLYQLSPGAQGVIFLFVKNTLTPTEAMMSEIYAKHKDEDGFLYMTYSGEDILCAAKTSLRIADSLIHEHGASASLPRALMPLLSTLEKLVSISDLRQDLKQRFEQVLLRWRDAFCKLLVCFSTAQDRTWVRKLQDLTSFDVRNRMIQSLFPCLEQQDQLYYLEDEDDQFQVLVPRANLFQESMTQVMAAEKLDFCAGISVQFQDEEAQGDGVLREWLYLICQNLIDPQRKLFTSSPDDSRRFSPDPKPFLVENHLDNYRFAGRIICLALKHNIQVGLLFEPLFFLQLTGRTCFCLEDLEQTDGELYKQFKSMLEMDDEAFDAAGGFDLTFSGLWADGDNKKVTSENRHNYISLTINERYLHQIRDQVLAFSHGVEDVIEEGVRADEFFSLLKLEDLDSMMYGSQEDNINVDEWYQSTDYVSYTSMDNVILWFWKVVYQMNQEDLHKLLCFWTSHRFLPRDGFHGLQRLSILRMNTGEAGSERRYFPTSRTCCYSMQLPAYSSYEETAKAMRYITKDYICSGFGDA